MPRTSEQGGNRHGTRFLTRGPPRSLALILGPARSLSGQPARGPHDVLPRRLRLCGDRGPGLDISGACRAGAVLAPRQEPHSMSNNLPLAQEFAWSLATSLMAASPCSDPKAASARCPRPSSTAKRRACCTSTTPSTPERRLRRRRRPRGRHRKAHPLCRPSSRSRAAGRLREPRYRLWNSKLNGRRATKDVQ